MTAPTTSAAAVTSATGRDGEQWFALLDGSGAIARPHGEIARWLADEHGVASWWTQAIAVRYERARGLRGPGERPDGFAITASKTVGVPVERLFAAFADEALRERWLPGAKLALRTATAPRTARYDWGDGSTRIAIGFTSLGEAKSSVALMHERLPNADAAQEMKAFWRERTAALKAVLDDGDAPCGS